MEIVLVGQMDMMMVVMMVSLLDNTMVVHLVYALVVN